MHRTTVPGLQRKLSSPQSTSATPSPSALLSTSESAGAAASPQLGHRFSQLNIQSPSEAAALTTAKAGTGGTSQSLPHGAAIQRAFGHHDISPIQAHLDGQAKSSAEAMGAEAYAMGSHVAFGSSPSLFTAAHEAAHVVQQRSTGPRIAGLGMADDVHERHADQVAARVAQGLSAEKLLDEYAQPRAAAAMSTPGQPLAVQFKFKGKQMQAQVIMTEAELPKDEKLARAVRELLQELNDSPITVEYDLVIRKLKEVKRNANSIAALKDPILLESAREQEEDLATSESGEVGRVSHILSRHVAVTKKQQKKRLVDEKKKLVTKVAPKGGEAIAYSALLEEANSVAPEILASYLLSISSRALIKMKEPEYNSLSNKNKKTAITNELKECSDPEETENFIITPGTMITIGTTGAPPVNTVTIRLNAQLTSLQDFSVINSTLKDGKTLETETKKKLNMYWGQSAPEIVVQANWSDARLMQALDEVKIGGGVTMF